MEVNFTLILNKYPLREFKFSTTINKNARQGLRGERHTIMKRMALLFIFIAGVHVCCFAQQVYLHPNDYELNTGLAFSEVTVGPKYLKTELTGVIKATDSQRNVVKIKKDSVWGYESNKGKVYRLRSTNSIELVDTGALVIYKFSSLYWDSYFFSVSLDSKTYRLNRHNLVEQSTNKGCIIEALNKLNEMNIRIKSRKEESGIFYINDVLSGLNCKPFN